MGRQPETVLVTAIRKALLERWPDALVLKIAGGPYQEAGIPDLLVCVDGKFVGLEAKRRQAGESEEHARGRATPLQRAMLSRIERAGGTAAVVLSVEEALHVIEVALSST